MAAIKIHNRAAWPDILGIHSACDGVRYEVLVDGFVHTVHVCESGLFNINTHGAKASAGQRAAAKVRAYTKGLGL